MKTVIKIVFVILFFVNNVYSQVGINTTQVNSSTILHIESNNKGVLFPTLTQAQRDNINIVAESNGEVVPPGLTIYCSDCCTSGYGALFFYNGSEWKSTDSDCRDVGSFPECIPVTTTMLSSQHIDASIFPLIFDNDLTEATQTGPWSTRFHQGSTDPYTGDVIQFTLNEAIPAGGKIVLYWSDNEDPDWVGFIVDLDNGGVMSQPSIDTYPQGVGFPVLPNSVNTPNGNDDFILEITLIADTDTITVRSSDQDTWGEDPQLYEFKIFDDEGNEIPFTCN